jgi:UTP--glucose-1-phosphate uridylyltransferase
MKKLLLYAICGFSIYVVSCVASITQVIIPMAGLGTRLLPLTKAASKSMVPLVDRPALHHVVDEALQSNINDFCFIINEQDQQAIEEYFSPNLELDAILEARGKSHFLKALNDVIAQSTFTYIVQSEPIGLGHAVLMGEPFVTPGSFFCVMLPDNIIETADPHMAQLIAIAEKYNASVITVEEISREQASSYAVITPGNFLTDDLVEVIDIIEKPQSTESSICLGQMGRHVFSYDIFESLKAIQPGVNGEYQLTDAVRHMIKNGKRVLAYKIHGKRYDIGNIKGLLKATVSLGLHNPLYRGMLCDIFEKEMGITFFSK